MTQQTQGQSQATQPGGLAALLKPIKDLAQVWQVDIEPYIDQFVVQLTTQIIQDVDFREAALLVQQTSQLFARKVDFLYDFVNNILVSQPGKQRKRRTQAQQQFDLVLEYDGDDPDVFSSFYDVFTPQNAKVTQTHNLFLLPKHPHTMLSARQVIENQDVRITPVYNSICQQRALLLEQWADADLSLALDQNANIQPINHTTPVHPRYFERLAASLTQSALNENPFMSPQPMRTNDITLTGEPPIPNVYPENDFPDNSLLSADAVPEEPVAETSMLDSDALRDSKKSAKTRRLSKLRRQSLQDGETPQTLGDLREDFTLGELDVLHQIVSKHFKKIIHLQQMVSQEHERDEPFRKFVAPEVPEDGPKKVRIPGLFMEDCEEENELVLYPRPGAFFKEPCVPLVRRYASKKGVVLYQSKTRSPGLPSPLSVRSQPESPNQNASAQLPGPRRLSLSGGDLIQVAVQPLEQRPDLLDSASNQSQSQKQKQSQTRKNTATKVYTADYVRWIHRLEDQIARQTAFDIEKVEKHVLSTAKDFMKLHDMSQGMQLEKPETEKTKLARCFISSLFLASQGRAEFDQDNGVLKVKALSK